MPQFKGSGVGKRRKPQPLPLNVPTPVRKHYRQAGYGDSVKPVTHYSGYIGATSSLPIVSPQAQRELALMRRDAIRCEQNICRCICLCHTGVECFGPIDRVHTPGHKPTSVAVRPTLDEPCTVVKDCPFTSNHRHEIACHDRVDRTEDPRHWRTQGAY